MTKTGNEIRMNDAEKAIGRVWGDKTVAVEETIANLNALVEKIEIMIDALMSQ